jgi:hypothetical protein
MAARQHKTTMIKKMMNRMGFIPGLVVGIRFLLPGVGWNRPRSPDAVSSIMILEKKEHPSIRTSRLARKPA